MACSWTQDPSIEPKYVHISRSDKHPADGELTVYMINVA